MPKHRFTILPLVLLLVACSISVLPLHTAAALTTGTNTLTGLVLEAGQAAILHYQQVNSGRLNWRIELAGRPEGSETLEYSIHHQPATGQAAIVLYSGAMTALVMNGSLDNVAVGDVYIALRNTATQATSESGEIIFSTSFGPFLANDANRPPALELISPSPGAELWGSDIEVLLSVQAEPFYPVYFQTDAEAVPTDVDGYAETLIKLPTGLRHELQATTVGPTGHITTSRLMVQKHLLLEPPVVDGAHTRRPTLRFKVPDNSLIDLQRSTLMLNGQALMLHQGSLSNELYATVSENLPIGLTDARLNLTGLASSFSGQQPILEDYAWQIEIGSSRTIQLWPNKYTASINGEPYALDAAPFIDRSSAYTLVPFRFIAEAMGAEVGWLEETNQVTFELGTNRIVLTLGSLSAEVNGETVLMPMAPRIVKSRTMVPLRFVSEQLGATVDWEDATSTITIVTGE